MDALAIGDNDTRLVLATDAGYGFLTRFEALLGNKKAGKQLINMDDDAHVLAPAYVGDPARDRIVVVTTEGHLLMFSVADLPELDRGRGNKLIEIPKAKLQSGEERVAGIAAVAEGSGEVTLYAGARTGWRGSRPALERFGVADCDKPHDTPELIPVAVSGILDKFVRHG